VKGGEQQEMNRKLILVLSISLLLSAGVRSRLDEAGDMRVAAGGDDLYIRSGKTLKKASLGFNGLLSDIYWIRTVHYFGAEIEEQRLHGQNLDFGRMPLLEELLSLTTDLDPNHLAAYRFGAFFLAYQDAEKAIRFTERGIAGNPQEWRLYQDLGFIYWRVGRYRDAGEADSRGGRLTGAPEWMKSMGATLIARGGDTQTARKMFIQLYRESEDEFIKEICLEQLELIGKQHRR